MKRRDMMLVLLFSFLLVMTACTQDAPAKTASFCHILVEGPPDMYFSVKESSDTRTPSWESFPYGYKFMIGKEYVIGYSIVTDRRTEIQDGKLINITEMSSPKYIDFIVSDSRTKRLTFVPSEDGVICTSTQGGTI